MRVLVWYWGRRGGGVHVTLSLAQAMEGGGFALSLSRQNAMIAAFRSLPAPRQEVDTYDGLPGFLAGSLRVPRLSAALRRFAAQQQARVVLSTMSHPWTPLIAPSLARAGLVFIPVIHDAVPHPGDPAPFFHWRLRRELAAARAAVVLSDAVARQVQARRPDLPLIRIPLGAHLPGGAPAAEASADFLFFGRIRAYKGLDLLRDAWPRVRAGRPGARLRVVGEGDLDACAPGLAALPGVEVDRRWVPDGEMASVLTSARALVLPYREASQSGVLPLALALGIPVVATAVGGLAEQVRDAENGLVTPPTAEALAAAMIRMLDAPLRARLAEGARRTGATLADWAGQWAALRAGIADVLARPA
jgi:glycosyltransferase involved in cell wall biosynthesis